MYLKNLIQLRKYLGFNQKDFAEQLGIKQTTYNGYEKGKTDPGIDFLKMVAQKYSVTTDYLAGLTDVLKIDIKKAPPSEDEDAVKTPFDKTDIIQQLSELPENKVRSLRDYLAFLIYQAQQEKGE